MNPLDIDISKLKIDTSLTDKEPKDLSLLGKSKKKQSVTRRFIEKGVENAIKNKGK